MRLRPLAVCFAALCAFAVPAHAETPPDVADLVGARGAGGETQLLSRGYEARQSNTVRDQRFTFWWNAQRSRCISVSTVDGRYASIQTVPSENCRAGSGQSSAPAGAATDANSLVLVCYGAGTRPSMATDSTYSWDKEKHKWKESNTLRSTTEGFSSDVQVELYGDHGRIHLGPDLVPPIHSGGDHGWWDLSNLLVTPDRITATYKLNGMNKPKLTIDRRSGRITLSGLTEFSGQCDVGNWGGGQRRF